MSGQLVHTHGPTLSRRRVAQGTGGGAAVVALAALGLGASTRSVGAQEEEDGQEFLDAWVEAWASESGEEVAAMFTEDGVYEDVPFETTVEGRSAIAEYLQPYFEETEDFTLTIESSVAIPDGFLVQWRDEFTHVPTGNSVSYRGVTILEVVDGQIARETDYYDQATVYTQQGGTCQGPVPAATPVATPAGG